MTEIHRLLPGYFDILTEKKMPSYVQSKHQPVSFEKTDELKVLWEKHDESLLNPSFEDDFSSKSLLDLKVEIAHRLFKKCCFCEHRCEVNRENQTGRCNVKQSLIASEFLHFGEEDVLVPSYTIFFSGCTFRCVFCQNWDISQHKKGEYSPPVS